MGRAKYARQFITGCHSDGYYPLMCPPVRVVTLYLVSLHANSRDHFYRRGSLTPASVTY
jgi:hypothetical protein